MSANDGNFVDWRENEACSDDDDADDYDDDYVGYEEDDAGNVVKVGQERRNRQSSNENSRVDLAAKYRFVCFLGSMGCLLAKNLSIPCSIPGILVGQ